MLRRYTFWLTAAVLFQFLSGLIHTLNFFTRPDLRNDTERQIYELITTYRSNMGAGFNPTFWNLFTALSVSYSLLCLLGGLTLGYLMLKHTQPYLMRGIIAINLAIFGVCFIVMFFLTFLPPVLLTGLIVFNLFAAFLLVPKIESVV